MRILLFFLYLISIISYGQQTICSFTFDSIPSTCIGTKKPFYTSPYCNVSSWSNTSTLGTSGSPMCMFPFVLGQSNYPVPVNQTDRSYWGQNWTLSSSPNLSQYFQFTTSSNTGFPFKPVSISLWCQRSSTGPTLISVRSSQDGYTTNLLTGTPTTSGVVISGNLSPVLTPALSFTFRIYGYGSSGSTGAMRVDNVILYEDINIPLPIELTYFNAQSSGNSVLCRWETVTENNNDYFDIERSENASDFNPIGRVEGVGNSIQSIRYQFLDTNPLNGTSYYRLKQVDINGEYQYSNIEAILIKKPFVYQIDGDIYVSGETGTRAILLNSIGQHIDTGIITGTLKFHPNSRGIFIVVSNGSSTKVIVP